MTASFDADCLAQTFEVGGNFYMDKYYVLTTEYEHHLVVVSSRLEARRYRESFITRRDDQSFCARVDLSVV
jgi:hypothetical protein